jgi:hypothetical protein
VYVEAIPGMYTPHTIRAYRTIETAVKCRAWGFLFAKRSASRSRVLMASSQNESAGKCSLGAFCSLKSVQLHDHVS